MSGIKKNNISKTWLGKFGARVRDAFLFKNPYKKKYTITKENLLKAIEISKSLYDCVNVGRHNLAKQIAKNWWVSTSKSQITAILKIPDYYKKIAALSSLSTYNHRHYELLLERIKIMNELKQECDDLLSEADVCTKEITQYVQEVYNGFGKRIKNDPTSDDEFDRNRAGIETFNFNLSVLMNDTTRVASKMHRNRDQAIQCLRILHQLIDSTSNRALELNQLFLINCTKDKRQQHLQNVTKSYIPPHNLFGDTFFNKAYDQDETTQREISDIAEQLISSMLIEAEYIFAAQKKEKIVFTNPFEVTNISQAQKKEKIIFTDPFEVKNIESSIEAFDCVSEEAYCNSVFSLEECTSQIKSDAMTKNEDLFGEELVDDVILNATSVASYLGVE